MTEKSPWSKPFWLFRDLEEKYCGYDPIKIEELILNHLQSVNKLEKFLEEIKSAKLQMPEDKFLKQAYIIAETAESEDLDCRGKIYEDVYQLAFYFSIFSVYRFWEAFRGQQKHWPLLPSLYRGRRNGKQASPKTITKRLKNLESFLWSLKKDFLDGWGNPLFNDKECLAIAQHYTKESVVKTWLLDVTKDPFIALYFATSGTNKIQTNDIGCLFCFSPKQWNRDWNCTDLLGRFQLIQPQNVPRIKPQQAGALMFSGPPEVLEQDVPFVFYFFQKPGLVFEDSERNITTAKLIPKDDMIAHFIKKRQISELQQKNYIKKVFKNWSDTQKCSKQSRWKWSFPLSPPKYRSGGLQQSINFYYKLLNCWMEVQIDKMEHLKNQRTPSWVFEALNGAACLHARLQYRKDKVQRTYLRSLRCLSSALEHIIFDWEENRVWQGENDAQAIRLLKHYWNGQDLSPFHFKDELNNLQPNSFFEACIILADIIADSGVCMRRYKVSKDF